MTKISNVEQTTSSSVIPNEITGVLPNGKEIVIKKQLSLGEIARLSFYFGKSSDNHEFYGLVNILCLVKKIGGNPIPFPQTENEIFELAELIGTEGFNFIDESLGGMPDEDGIKEQIKK